MTPTPKRWRHVILNTRCSWLAGDPRGFRNRDHRIHSSGDYRNPPPQGEHAGLYRWMKERSGPKVVFEEAIWQTVADALRKKLTERGHRVLAVAASAVHVHLLAELPNLPSLYKHEVGVAKRYATERVKQAITGHLWAQGGAFKPIRDHDHQRNVFEYITKKQRPAWVWDYREEGRLVC